MRLLGIAGALFVGAGAGTALWAGLQRIGRIRASIPDDVGYRPGKSPRAPSRFAALTGVVDGAVARRGGSLAKDLRRAGIAKPPGELVLSVGAGCVAVAFLTALMTRSVPVALLFGGAAALAARLAVRRRAAGWTARFEEQLPDALDLLAGSLEAGSSLAQSMEIVAAEGRAPLREELARVLADNALGEPLPDALEASAARVGSREYAWCVRAVRVQQEFGASLADLFRTLAEFIRWRQELRREVRALTAEGRISAYILVGLPFAVGGYFAMVRPDYIGTLFSRPLGWMMVATAAALMAAGMVWMSKIVKVEV